MTESQSKNLESMIGFVSDAGGKLRFDHYIEEHLYGSNGYYRIWAEIGSGDFGTESFRPAFVHLVFLNLQQNNLTGKDFLELGSGTGAFKENYLTHSPETNYISVEISEKSASMQEKGNGKVIISDAAALGLDDNSIDGVVFSNELIDALPCRVFRLTKANGKTRINEEGYVRTDGNALYFEFQDTERDEFLETYEKFLNQGIYPVEDSDIISVSPKTIDVIRESLRVVKSGKIMFIDYGFGKPIGCERKSQEVPFIFKGLDPVGLSEILANPYNTDITHSIDFEFLKWITKKIDQNVQVNYHPQVSLLSVLPQYNHSQIPKPYDHFDTPLSPFLVLSIDKQAG